jgi:hypothetical protein
MITFVFLLATGLSPGHAQDDNPDPPDEPVKLIFIHHSVGESWLEDDYGDLGRMLSANNYFVSDTNYGWGPGNIGDNTDIVNWPEWFGPERSDRVLEALYGESEQNSWYTRTLSDPGGENEIIMFKSCYPNSELDGSPNDGPTSGDYDYTVGSAKHIYNLLLDYFITRPDKMFVVITAPPVTYHEMADNARAFNNWLVYDWLSGYSGNNVFVFDLYNVLTGRDHHHRYLDADLEHVYAPGSNTLYYPTDDNHPNADGSQKATDEFVPLLNIFYHRWRSGAPAQPPVQTSAEEPEQEEAEQEEPVSGGPVSVAGLIDDFESGFSSWEFSDDGMGSHLTYDLDSGMAYAGGNALRIEYEIAVDGWVDSGRYYDTPQDWSASDGVSFYLRSELSGYWMVVMVVTGEGERTNPFEAYFDIPQESTTGWEQIYFPWSDFELASWGDTSGPGTIDPSSVVGFGFSMGADSEQIENVVWIDEIRLGAGGVQAQPDDEQDSQVETGQTSQDEGEMEEEQETEDDEDGGGFLGTNCPLSTVALPLVVFAAALRRKRRRDAAAF